MINDGVLQQVTVESAATGGDLEAILYPPEGCCWRVLVCLGWHDDPAARTCHFRVDDGLTAVANLSSSVALAADQFHGLYGDIGCLEPIRIRYGQAICWLVEGLAVGKKGYIRAIVQEERGERPYAVTRGP